MKKYFVTTLTGISVLALLAGGCANKGAVKKEEAVVPVVAAQKTDDAKAAEAAQAAKAKADADAAAAAAAATAAAEAKAKEDAEMEARNRAIAASKPAGAVVVAPADSDMDMVVGRRNAENSANASVTTVSPFETVYFDFDKSDLRQDSRDVLSKNAESILKSYPAAKIQIEGHCDERGSAEYNLALGERRAKSAQKYLTTLNVKAENLSIISYGKEKAAVNGNDEAAWAKNRRAEFVVVK